MSLTDRSAVDLAAAIRSREVSCAEVMQAFLDRIEAVNPTVNGIVSLRPHDVLMAEARAADEVEPGGALHGLPIAIKDLVSTAGIPTTFGSPALAANVPRRDDLIAARIREAGAIVVGKTNTPEFGFGSHTTNPVFGPTRNPYDTDLTPGGSSGGASAALAARMLPVADGSDMMGSLRNPAAWCNVYGLRPTPGMVPNDAMGAVREGLGDLLATCGPMGRSPADMALLMDVIARADPRQPNDLPRPASWVDTLDGDASMKVGWLGDWGLPFEPGVLAFCRDGLAPLADIGCTLDEAHPVIGLKDAWFAWSALRANASRVRLQPFVAQFGVEALGHNARHEWDWVYGIDLQEVRLCMDKRQALIAELDRLFETFDVLVLPSAQRFPFPAEWDFPRETAGVEADTYHRWMEVVVPVSLAGAPAVALPVGFNDEGLPMGVQAFARRGEDAKLMRLAARWHEATRWPERRPPPL